MCTPAIPSVFIIFTTVLLVWIKCSSDVMWRRHSLWPFQKLHIPSWAEGPRLVCIPCCALFSAQRAEVLWINAFGVIVLGQAKEILEVCLLLRSWVGWKIGNTFLYLIWWQWKWFVPALQIKLFDSAKKTRDSIAEGHRALQGDSGQ